MGLPLVFRNDLQLCSRRGWKSVSQCAYAAFSLIRSVAIVDACASRCGPLGDGRLAERIERYVLPTREMKSLVEPCCSIAVYPARTMAHAGVEPVFDLRSGRPGQGRNPCIEIGK